MSDRTPRRSMAVPDAQWEAIASAADTFGFSGRSDLLRSLGEAAGKLAAAVPPGQMPAQGPRLRLVVPLGGPFDAQMCEDVQAANAPRFSPLVPDEPDPGTAPDRGPEAADLGPHGDDAPD
jgi:hypothetical protein